MQPDQEGGRSQEVKCDVGDPEDGRQGRHPVSRVLNRALAEDVQMAFERDDFVGVPAGDRQGSAPLSAHDLVERVEAEDRGDLHQASVRGRHEAPGGGEAVEGRHAHDSQAMRRRSAVQCG